MTKTCDRCRASFEAGSNRARWCSPECRRAARTEYEEVRASHVFAGARIDPDKIPTPGNPTAEDDLRESLTYADGVPAYGEPHGDRPAYLAARRAFLDTLARTRRGWTRTARGWSIPETSGPCAGCPILALPWQCEITDRWEREDQEAEIRLAVEESLAS